MTIIFWHRCQSLWNSITMVLKDLMFLVNLIWYDHINLNISHVLYRTLITWNFFRNVFPIIIVRLSDGSFLSNNWSLLFFSALFSNSQRSYKTENLLLFSVSLFFVGHFYQTLHNKNTYLLRALFLFPIVNMSDLNSVKRSIISAEIELIKCPVLDFFERPRSKFEDKFIKEDFPLPSFAWFVPTFIVGNAILDSFPLGSVSIIEKVANWWNTNKNGLKGQKVPER